MKIKGNMSPRQREEHIERQQLEADNVAAEHIVKLYTGKKMREVRKRESEVRLSRTFL